MNENTARNTISFGVALALCSVLNALLVIAKESNNAFERWMQRITGHHWITHVVIILLLFLFFGWLFRTSNVGVSISLTRLANIVAAGLIAGVLIIVGFYVVAG